MDKNHYCQAWSPCTISYGPSGYGYLILIRSKWSIFKSAYLHCTSPAGKCHVWIYMYSPIVHVIKIYWYVSSSQRWIYYRVKCDCPQCCFFLGGGRSIQTNIGQLKAVETFEMCYLWYDHCKCNVRSLRLNDRNVFFVCRWNKVMNYCHCIWCPDRVIIMLKRDGASWISIKLDYHASTLSR